MATELDSMVKEYEQQSLMMSEELKKAKEQDIVDMNNSMQSYQLSKVGPNGELTRKQAQLEYDLVQKFKNAVDSVAISKGYDIIMDGSQASLYTKPTHDLTDDVLYELRKASDQSK
jgi:outer membrane protein